MLITFNELHDLLKDANLFLKKKFPALRAGKNYFETEGTPIPSCGNSSIAL